MRRALILGLVVLAGCAGATGGSVAIGQQQPSSPISRPWSAAFASRAQAWLDSQPPFHQHKHHNGILLISAMTSAGDWHGLLLEPDGTLQPLNAGSHDDSYAIANLVSVGDEINLYYPNSDFLMVTGGNRDLVVMHRAAVTP